MKSSIKRQKNRMERKFDKDLMLEVIGYRPGKGFEENGVGYKVLRREQIDSRRWVAVYEVVFQVTENGNTTLWCTDYERGLTEHQCTSPWEDDDEVTAFQVKPVEKTITVYEPITE